MNNLADSSSPLVASISFIDKLGWLLVHSVWQFGLIAVLIAMFYNLMHRSSAKTRYGLLLAAMLAFAVTPLVTWRNLPASRFSVAGVLAPLEVAVANNRGPTLEAGSDLAIRHPLLNNSQATADQQLSPTKPTTAIEVPPWDTLLLDAVRPWLSEVVGGWCLGVLLFSVRPILGWWIVHRLRTVGVSAVPESVQQAFVRVCGQMQVTRRVRVLQSGLATTPVMVGCWRSVVLLPVSFISNVPLPQLEAILAHELAHVQRYDYQVNLLQMVLETLFFYHPAVWWVSHRLRLERELSCDDRVVDRLGNRLEYGRALLAVEQLRRQSAATNLAISAGGGSLLVRVRRLIEPTIDHRSHGAEWISLAILSLGLLTAAIWATGAPAAQPTVDFGPESHGLQARIVPLRPEVNDESPDLSAVQDTFGVSDAMTFAVELKNVSDSPISLVGLQELNPDTAAPAAGKSAVERTAAYLFEFEFTDTTGKPISRAERHYYQAWHRLASTPICELAPGQAVTTVLRPARFPSPMHYDLPPGTYHLRIRYHGGATEDRKKIAEFFPTSPLLTTWAYSVESNSVAVTIADGSTSAKVPTLVWGPEQDGLQAAIAYQVYGKGNLNPAEPPGMPVGTQAGVVFHVRNVSDQPISFISETGRQGDSLEVTDEQGRAIPVPDAFFTGWPIDVAWKLLPSEEAQLQVLTPNLPKLDQAGRYRVRGVIRFKSRILKDQAGNVIFPQPGDYDQSLATGETSLFVASPQSDSGKAIADRKPHSTSSVGRWQITDDVEMEIAQRIYHGADVTSQGVLRWQKNRLKTRHVPVSIASDYFANRVRWIAAWEEGRPVLWLAAGLASGPGRRVPDDVKVKVDELQRIDFSDPDCIRHSTFSGWDNAQTPSPEIRAKLEQGFIIPAVGAEEYRYYEAALPGIDPVATTLRLFLFVNEDGECRINDPIPEPGQAEELKCGLDELPQRLAMLTRKIRAAKGDNVPIVAWITTRPALAGEKLVAAIEACKQAGVVHPTVARKMNRVTPVDNQGKREDGQSEQVHEPALPITDWLRFCPGTQVVEHTTAAYVSGVVVDVTGKPISGCAIEHPGLAGPKTNEDGKFEYKQSVPHRTVLRVFHPEYQLWYGSPSPGDVLRIVLHKKPPPGERLDGQRTMTVRVIDSQTAAPVPNVEVTAICWEGPKNKSVAGRATTNADGIAVMDRLDYIQHELQLAASRPVPYIANRAYPGGDEPVVAILVKPACQLTLRAVDSETGEGIEGVAFGRENAAGEMWLQTIEPDILGGNLLNQPKTTGIDGVFRCLVSTYPWSYMVSQYPVGYASIVPIDGRQEVEIATPAGGEVEYEFRLVRSRLSAAPSD